MIFCNKNDIKTSTTCRFRRSFVDIKQCDTNKNAQQLRADLTTFN
jgi:hypothetical protein